MGKKGKKKQADDWEDEADVIAQEAAAEAVAVREPGALLDALFVDLIARGIATEADCDKATDELAEGKQTEEALAAEWQAKLEEAASFDKQYGHDGEAVEPPEAKGAKSRRWRQEEAGSRLLEDEAETPEDIAKKLEAHAQIFGAAADAPHAYDLSADGYNPRQRMTLSQLGVEDWRCAANKPPKALPLAGMTVACLFGPYGLSTHGDRQVCTSGTT